MTLNSIEITGCVLNSFVFRLTLGVLRRETRRGRESNPRIAVLQTATLPLGYPANSARSEGNVGAQRVNASKRFVIDDQ
jgi:hypothetical protein